AQLPQTSGYSVVLYFDPRVNTQVANFVPSAKIIEGTLNVSRNGSKPARFSLVAPTVPLPADVDNIAFDSIGFPTVEIRNIHRGNDVIEWSVDQGGEIAYN